jgi:hypothetical protein
VIVDAFLSTNTKWWGVESAEPSFSAQEEQNERRAKKKGDNEEEVHALSLSNNQS